MAVPPIMSINSGNTPPPSPPVSPVKMVFEKMRSWFRENKKSEGAKLAPVEVRLITREEHSHLTLFTEEKALPSKISTPILVDMGHASFFYIP